MGAGAATERREWATRPGPVVSGKVTAAPSVEPRTCRLGNGGERSEPPGKRWSAQRPKGAEATGIAAEIGAQRRLQRRARPRSGSPDFIDRAATASVFGTDIADTIDTGIGIDISTVVTVSVASADIDERIIITGDSVGRRELWPSVTTA